MGNTTAREGGSRWCWATVTVRSWTMFAVLATPVLGASPESAARGATLRWKFKPGETLRYTMEQQTVTIVKTMGQEFKTTLTQTVNLHWSIKQISSDGLVDLTQTIDRVRTKIDSPITPFEYDSETGKAVEGPATAHLVPLLKAMVGAEFSFKMNERGELSAIKVPEKLLETIRQVQPAGGGGGVFSEEGMKNLITQSSLALPEAALDNGKTWTLQTKVPVPMIGTMVMNKSYTFHGPDSKEADLMQIGLNTKVTLEPAADANITVKIKSQEGKGDFTFDAAAGRMVASRVNDQMEMSLSVMGQDLDETTDTVTTMTLAKDRASK
jgi:hypothetical protein